MNIYEEVINDNNSELSIYNTEGLYEEFYGLASELGYPVPEVHVETEVLDANGISVSKVSRRAHSWTRNAYNLLLSQLASCMLASGLPGGEGRLNLLSTASGLASSVSYTSSMSDIYAAAGTSTYGIAVGASGITLALPTFNDHKLGHQVNHGAAGVNDVLSYSAVVNVSESWVTNQLFSHVFKRYFNNNSGSSINIEETGIIYRLVYYNGTLNYCLFCRDVLAAPETIVDGGQYIVTYTIQLAYP